MTPNAKPALILVVEDEDALRRDIIEELQEAGYDTLAARDGTDAMDLLAAAAPDLVLCDITMPGLDGYDVLHALRKLRPELSTVPFVFLTALSDPYEIVEGKRRGADDYLVKPVDYDLMLATIAARLRQVDRLRTHHESEMNTLRDTLVGLSGNGAQAALDLITLGAVLLDENAKPILRNRAANRMAEDGDFFDFAPHGVRSSDPLSDRALQDAIGAAMSAASRGQKSVVGVRLNRVTGGDAITVLVCGLSNSGPGQPHVALFISAPDDQRHIPESLLMDIFGLTPTEARVAGSLARCNRAADVAAELGVTQTTIAFHMRNLFQKTGTNRQADLIALIMAGPMMIQTD